MKLKNTFLALFALMFAFSLQAQVYVVAPDGDVGIGVQTPANKLHVDGSILIPNSRFYISFRNNGTTKQQVFGMDSNNDITFNRSALTQDRTSGLILGCADKWIDFRHKDNTNIMRIDHNSRNVGIGTGAATPTAKLQVNGNIQANNVSFRSSEDSDTYISIKDVVGEMKASMEEMSRTVETLRAENAELRSRLEAMER